VAKQATRDGSPAEPVCIGVVRQTQSIVRSYERSKILTVNFDSVLSYLVYIIVAMMRFESDKGLRILYSII